MVLLALPLLNNLATVALTCPSTLKPPHSSHPKKTQSHSIAKTETLTLGFGWFSEFSGLGLVGALLPRKLIQTEDGPSPIALLVYDWASAELGSTLAAILIQEVDPQKRTFPSFPIPQTVLRFGVRTLRAYRVRQP